MLAFLFVKLKLPNFGDTTRKIRGRRVGRQAHMIPAHSSPNDQPAGAMLLYVKSSPLFKKSMRIIEMVQVLMS